MDDIEIAVNKEGPSIDLLDLLNHLQGHKLLVQR